VRCLRLAEMRFWKMLKDGFCRNINYLRFSVTDNCNLNCRYCIPGEPVKRLPPAELLSDEEIVTLVLIFKELGIEKFRFTGGEPFARAGAMELFKKISRITGNMHIITNLALPSLNIEKINAINLKSINVSCDSLVPEKYREVTRGGALSVFLENFSRLKTSSKKINVVIIKDFNDNEVPDFIKFAVQNRVTVRFIEKMSSDCDCLSMGDEAVNIDIMRKNLVSRGVLDRRPFREDNSVALYHFLKGSKTKVGFIMPVSRPFCGSCNKIRITSEGKLKLCLFRNDGLDLKKILRSNIPHEKIKYMISAEVLNKPFDGGVHRSIKQMVKVGG